MIYFYILSNSLFALVVFSSTVKSALSPSHDDRLVKTLRIQYYIISSLPQSQARANEPAPRTHPSREAIPIHTPQPHMHTFVDALKCKV